MLGENFESYRNVSRHSLCSIHGRKTPKLFTEFVKVGKYIFWPMQPNRERVSAISGPDREVQKCASILGFSLFAMSFQRNYDT